MQNSVRSQILRHAGFAIAALLLGGCATLTSGGDDSPVGPMYGVLLDPGHGGQPGAGRNREECFGAISNNGYMEKEATLAVAQKVKMLLEQKGISTAMTRTSDTYVSLDERAAKACRAEYRDWVFVSIHFNRSMSKQRATDLNAKYQHPRGFEIYIVPPKGGLSSDGHAGYLTINQTQSANLSLAECLQSRLTTVPELRSRGIKRAWFAVLRCNSMPGVLIEAGFLSNPEESRLIESDDYQCKLAHAIVAGISDYQVRHSTFARK